MRVEPVLEGDGGHAPVLGQLDAPLRQVEVEGLARLPRAAERAIGGVERRDDVPDERFGPVRRRAVLRGLNLGIFQRGARPHQAAHEAMIAQRPVLADDHAHGEAGARHTLVQAAQIARQRVGQHRHDPVGEIGGIAALLRLPVQRAAGRT
jgi:hypothetical protein